MSRVSNTGRISGCTRWRNDKRPQWEPLPSVRQGVQAGAEGVTEAGQELAREPNNTASVATDVWLELQKQIILGAPERIVDGGNQIISLSTFLSGAYFTAVAFAQVSAIATWWLRLLYAGPILCWVMSLVFAVVAVVPLRHFRVTLGDPLSGKDMLVDLAVNRVVWLRLGLIFQIVGILAMLVVLWFRLAVQNSGRIGSSAMMPPPWSRPAGPTSRAARSRLEVAARFRGFRVKNLRHVAWQAYRVETYVKRCGHGQER